jgi:tetratricopeptide (TPR) repeat protein
MFAATHSEGGPAVPDALSAKIVAAPPDRRQLLLRNLPVEQIRQISRDLTARAYELAWTGVHDARTTAEIAVAGSELLGSHPADRDLQASARAALGNALRLCADFHGAARELRTADMLAASGTGDSSLIAAIFEQIATLQQDLRKFPVALALLRQAQSLHELAGRTDMVARSLVSQGIVQGYSGAAEDAVETLTKAIRLLDGSNTRLRLSAVHSMCWFLVDMGYPERALRCFKRAQAAGFYGPLAGSPLQAARRTWLHGHILAGLGWIGEAEAALNETRSTYMSLRKPQEAALCSLELATLYADHGRWDLLPGVVAETLPIFFSLGIDREARAARLLQSAARSRETASRILRCVVTAVQRRSGATT